MIDFSSKLTGDLSGALDKFEKDVKGKVLISGVAAMAKVIYDEVKLNTEKHVKTGTLRDSIYRVYADDKSSDDKKVYRVGPNKSKAPHWHFLEYGTSKQPATPFIRPALGKMNDAINAGKARMSERMGEIKIEGAD